MGIFMMKAMKQHTHHREDSVVGKVDISFIRREGGKVEVFVWLNIAIMAIRRGREPARV